VLLGTSGCPQGCESHFFSIAAFHFLNNLSEKIIIPSKLFGFCFVICWWTLENKFQMNLHRGQWQK
jgi:hypothetical protein